MTKYFYYQEGKLQGPLDKRELKDRNLTSDTLVWTNEMSQWVPASEVPDLKEILDSAISEIKETEEVKIVDESVKPSDSQSPVAATPPPLYVHADTQQSGRYPAGNVTPPPLYVRATLPPTEPRAIQNVVPPPSHVRATPPTPPPCTNKNVATPPVSPVQTPPPPVMFAPSKLPRTVEPVSATLDKETDDSIDSQQTSESQAAGGDDNISWTNQVTEESANINLPANENNKDAPMHPGLLYLFAFVSGFYMLTIGGIQAKITTTIIYLPILVMSIVGIICCRCAKANYNKGDTKRFKRYEDIAGEMMLVSCFWFCLVLFQGCIAQSLGEI